MKKIIEVLRLKHEANLSHEVTIQFAPEIRHFGVEKLSFTLVNSHFSP